MSDTYAARGVGEHGVEVTWEVATPSECTPTDWPRMISAFNRRNGFDCAQDPRALTPQQLAEFKGMVTRGLVADMWQARNWRNQLAAKGLL